MEYISVRLDEMIIFRGLSLHVKQGESGCVCGPSGSGKTTLLRTMLGFVPLCEGTIRVHGETLMPRTVDRIRQHTAWVPQETAFPSEWVSDLVQMPFRLKANHALNFRKERLMAHFASLDLAEELYDKRVSEISGGQKQRILLAVAALLEKPVFVVDEPTSALDPDACDRVIHFFRSLCNQGTAILTVSHDKRFAAGCDRVFNL